jgi:O-antigen ligase
MVATFTFIYTIMNSNVSIAKAGMDLRVLFHLSLFFLVVYYVKSHRQLKTLILGIGIISGILAVMQLIQWAVGHENDILGVRLEALSTAGHDYGDISRVMLPGTPVILFSLNTFLAIYVFNKLRIKLRILLIIAIALLAAGMIATFSRALWVSVIVALFIIILLAQKRKRSYPRVIMLIASTVVIIILVMRTTFLANLQVKDAIFSRTMSIVNMPRNIQDDTLWIRIIEFQYAWEKILDNPLIGIGFRTSYRPNIFGNVDYERRTAGTFVHSGYLAIQLKMGLLGTTVFLWMMGTFFVRTRRRLRKLEDPLYRAVVIGIFVSIVGILIFSITSPAPIMFIYWVTVTAIGFGIAEKIFQLEGIT